MNILITMTRCNVFSFFCFFHFGIDMLITMQHWIRKTPSNDTHVNILNEKKTLYHHRDNRISMFRFYHIFMGFDSPSGFILDTFTDCFQSLAILYIQIKCASAIHCWIGHLKMRTIQFSLNKCYRNVAFVYGCSAMQY